MIFIFLLALILFGPKRLPEIAREVGKFVAEFKRASNDFKYQLQNEIENAGKDVPPAATPSASSSAQPAAQQQTSSFTQTLLPPAVKSVISDIDNAHDRLMKTARMAFDAQNFTLRPTETTPAPEAPTAQTEIAAPAAGDAPQNSSATAEATREAALNAAQAEAAYTEANKTSAPGAAQDTSSSAPQNS